jgi:hypothetical protein
VGREPGWGAVATGRPPMQSPGRPPVARKEQRRLFWAAIACGATSTDAGLDAGVSEVVGTRWFRECGGVTPQLEHQRGLRVLLRDLQEGTHPHPTMERTRRGPATHIPMDRELLQSPPATFHTRLLDTYRIRARIQNTNRPGSLIGCHENREHSNINKMLLDTRPMGCLDWADRALFAALIRRPRCCAGIASSPRPLLRWHRRLVTKKWPNRTAPVAHPYAIAALIERLAQENENLATSAPMASCSSSAIASAHPPSAGSFEAAQVVDEVQLLTISFVRWVEQRAIAVPARAPGRPRRTTGVA